MVQVTLTLKMTAAQVVETSVTVNNSPIQDYTSAHRDDHAQPTYRSTWMLSQFDVDFYMSIIIMCYVGLETPLKIYGNLKGRVKGCTIC